jgi:hypothetical protein
VLHKLPEGLAIAVLAASPADVEHHLSVLPSSLHPLAIEAAFPSIYRQQSLTLDFSSLRDPNTACAVLHAATSGTTGASALQALELKNIPLICGDHLVQLMSAACKSASDVRLQFGYINVDQVLHRLDFPQLSHNTPSVHLNEALLQNSALTSLQLTFRDDPLNAFNLKGPFESCTGLQGLALSSSFSPKEDELTGLLAQAIAKLCCLTRLSLGPG